MRDFPEEGPGISWSGGQTGTVREGIELSLRRADGEVVLT